MNKPSYKSTWQRGQGLAGLPLALEIALALLLKVAILVVLWHAFFSDPQTAHMRLPATQIEQHLLAGAAPRAAQSSPCALSRSKAEHGAD